MNTVTKARPILFTGPMVRAILAGRKTQTRRVVKPQPFKAGEEWSSKTVTEAWNSGFVDVRCPFGNAGQRLWVRETWTWCSSADKEEERGITFKDGAQQFPNGNYYPNDHIDYLPTAFDHIKWHPSIYLPRWASRITLEVESIRIQEQWWDKETSGLNAFSAAQFGSVEKDGKYNYFRCLDCDTVVAPFEAQSRGWA